MKREVFVADTGDDKNDGFTKAVYSWKRATQLQGGRNDVAIRFLDVGSEARYKVEAEAADD